jgi:hypothetical protein
MNVIPIFLLFVRPRIRYIAAPIKLRRSGRWSDNILHVSLCNGFSDIRVKMSRFFRLSTHTKYVHIDYVVGGFAYGGP